MFQIRHGAPEDNYRHVGDLGNILAGDDGVAFIDEEDSQISLNGLNSIIGRGVVIHAGKDDLGKVRKTIGSRATSFGSFVTKLVLFIDVARYFVVCTEMPHNLSNNDIMAGLPTKN
jgi:hypothetical protein